MNVKPKLARPGQMPGRCPGKAVPGAETLPGGAHIPTSSLACLMTALLGDSPPIIRASSFTRSIRATSRMLEVVEPRETFLEITKCVSATEAFGMNRGLSTMPEPERRAN